MITRKELIDLFIKNGWKVERETYDCIDLTKEEHPRVSFFDTTIYCVSHNLYVSIPYEKVDSTFIGSQTNDVFMHIDTVTISF